MSNPKPGDEPEVMELHGKAFREVVGPILASQLGDRKYMHGHTFSAVDVIVGFVLAGVVKRRPSYLEAFPKLLEYAENMMNSLRLRGEVCQDGSISYFCRLKKVL